MVDDEEDLTSSADDLEASLSLTTTVPSVDNCEDADAAAAADDDEEEEADDDDDDDADDDDGAEEGARASALLTTEGVDEGCTHTVLSSRAGITKPRVVIATVTRSMCWASKWRFDSREKMRESWNLMVVMRV